jgi:hypothetical protein
LIFYIIFAIPALLIELAVWIVNTFRPIIESGGLLIAITAGLLAVGAQVAIGVVGSLIFRSSRRWFATVGGTLVMVAGSAVSFGLFFVMIILSTAVALLHATA